MSNAPTIADAATATPVAPVESSPAAAARWEPSLVAGVCLAALLAALAFVTLGRSIQAARHRKRRTAIAEELRPELLDRLYGPDDPDWTAWVTTLSRKERSILESLLEEYLRELVGADARRLAELADALGIHERARRRIRTGDRRERLHALTWLTLLEDAPPAAVLEEHCTATPEERAAAVRALDRSGHPDVATVGVDLLVGECSEPLPVFGVDTLYQAVQSDPSYLFERVAADAESWEPELGEQVLLICRHASTVAGEADLSGVVRSLSSPEERIRAEAIRALGGYGWRDSVRDRIDTGAICSDPSPRVRAATYRTLGEWGDDAALETLRAAAAAEPDPRVQVVAAEALVDHRTSPGTSPPAALTDAWAWATEHAAFDRLAADVSGGTGREVRSQRSTEVGSQ